MNPGRLPWAGMNDAFGVSEATAELHRVTRRNLSRTPSVLVFLQSHQAPRGEQARPTREAAVQPQYGRQPASRIQGRATVPAREQVGKGTEGLGVEAPPALGPGAKLVPEEEPRRIALGRVVIPRLRGRVGTAERLAPGDRFMMKQPVNWEAAPTDVITRPAGASTRRASRRNAFGTLR